MSRQFVVFALIVVSAVVSLSCTAAAADPPKASPNSTDVGADRLAPAADSVVGNTDGAGAPGTGKDAVEAPVGGPGAEGATGSAPAESPKSAASTLQFSVLATLTAVGASFF